MSASRVDRSGIPEQTTHALITSTRHMYRVLVDRLPSAQKSAFRLASQHCSRFGHMKSFATEGSNPYPPADASRGATADLCDVHLPDPVDIICQRKVQIVDPSISLLKDYGGHIRFSGQAATVKCFENNPLVRKALEEDGRGRVLVVDGGASHRCALLGDNIAEMGHKNGWSGIIINGCIRDSEDISKMPLGVKALNTYPLKSSKRDLGMRDIPITFGGVTFHPGHWIYADKDGILVSAEQLTVSS